MIHLQIKELIAAKTAQWGRKVTINEVAEATGISRMTLNRIMRNEGHNTLTNHIDQLCSFFQCELYDLVKYVPNSNVVITNTEQLQLVA